MRLQTPSCLALLLLASSAVAEPPPPAPGWGVRGSDDVALIRLYERASGATTAVGRTGLVVAKDGGEAVLVVGPAQAADLGTYTVRFGARRTKDGADVTWEVMPGASLLPAARGSHRVKTGTLGHVLLQSPRDHELFASVELGRASEFPFQQLASYFPGYGGPTAAAFEMRPDASRAPIDNGWPDAAPAPPPGSGWTAAAPVHEARPAPASLPHAQLVLSMRLERDGEVVTAPVVKVRNGEEFAVSTQTELEVAPGQAFQGIEIRGTPRFDGSTTWLDLSVQSGRALKGTATYLVDRYRQGVQAPLDQTVVVDLFENLTGASTGKLRLFLKVTRG